MSPSRWIRVIFFGAVATMMQFPVAGAWAAAQPGTCFNPAKPPVASPVVSISQPFDLTFIDRMIALHAESIAVASLGLQHAQDAEVRRMALRVAEGQAGEIQLLRHWRTLWYPDTATPIPSLLDTSDCNAQASFDSHFMAALIELHTREISLATTALDSAKEPALVEFAQTVIAARNDELDLIHRWLEVHSS